MIAELGAPPAIELRGASARSGSIVRLHPCSLAVPVGTVTAVIGPNGSGKSTLLALMASEIVPFDGSVLLEGDDIHRLDLTLRARRRAVLTQETAVSFPFTVRQVVSWGRIPWRGTERASDDDAIIDAAIAAQGLSALVDRPVTALSGGERKRVHIARVVAQQAGVLLLDEADADLDLVGRRIVDDLVVTHARRGGTAVVVSHDVSRLARVCDQIVLMSRGRVHAVGTPSEVLTEQRLSEAFGVPVAVDRDGDHLSVHIRQP